MKEGWEYKKLGDICTIVGRIGFRGYTKADLVKSPDDGAITLSPSNITNGELDFSKCTYISWNKYNESPEIMLEKGDVVLVKTASIGKCAVVKELPHKATLNPQFVVLKGIIGEPNFISYYLKSPVAQSTIKQMAGGVAIPTLSQKKLGTMQIPTPPLSEQQSIVEYLDASFAKIDAMKANAEKALNEAKALFQASLKEMLEPKEGWEYRKFESCLVKVPKQVQVKSKDYKKEGKYPIVSQEAELISGYWDDDTIVYNHKEPVVIFGDHTKIIKYIDFNFVVGADGTHILSTKEDINAKFFYYVLKSIKLRELGYARHYKLLKEKFIPVPPLSEQQSIVETLDTIKSKVDHLQENFDKISQECDALKQAILRDIFE